MRHHITRMLVVVGVCSLGIAHAAWASDAVPEIDAGTAAGALTLAVGALTLLGERFRRQ